MERAKGDRGAANRRLNPAECIPLLGRSQDALVLAEDLLAQGAVPSRNWPKQRGRVTDMQNEQ